VGVTGPFGTVTWEYDAFSRRVKQHDTAPAGPEIVRDLIWEGLSIIESRNQATGEIRRYYGNGEERELAAAVTRLHYTTDHLGSIRELTDATGTIRARYDYDPYGNVTKLSGSLDTDFAYTGHYYHAASGLHLAPYRGYDPRLGRWLSRDPIDDGEFIWEGPNLYRYVANAPATYRDPDGRIIPVIVWGIFAYGALDTYAHAPDGGPEPTGQTGMSKVCSGALVGLLGGTVARGAITGIAASGGASSIAAGVTETAALLQIHSQFGARAAIALIAAMSKTPAGCATLSSVHRVVSAMAGHASSPEALNAILTIQNATGIFSQGGK
jgi:RHS repeat-associated protein